jgi:hypothetical protein
MGTLTLPSNPERNRIRPARIPDRHAFACEFAHVLDVLGHHQIQAADDSWGAKESNLLPFCCFGVKKFHVVDQHIG